MWHYSTYLSPANIVLLIEYNPFVPLIILDVSGIFRKYLTNFALVEFESICFYKKSGSFLKIIPVLFYAETFWVMAPTKNKEIEAERQS